MTNTFVVVYFGYGGGSWIHLIAGLSNSTISCHTPNITLYHLSMLEYLSFTNKKALGREKVRVGIMQKTCIA